MSSRVSGASRSTRTAPGRGAARTAGMRVQDEPPVRPCDIARCVDMGGERADRLAAGRRAGPYEVVHRLAARNRRSVPPSSNARISRSMTSGPAAGPGSGAGATWGRVGPGGSAGRSGEAVPNGARHTHERRHPPCGTAPPCTLRSTRSVGAPAPAPASCCRAPPGGRGRSGTRPSRPRYGRPAAADPREAGRCPRGHRRRPPAPAGRAR